MRLTVLGRHPRRLITRLVRSYRARWSGVSSRLPGGGSHRYKAHGARTSERALGPGEAVGPERARNIGFPSRPTPQAATLI